MRLVQSVSVVERELASAFLERLHAGHSLATIARMIGLRKPYISTALHMTRRPYRESKRYPVIYACPKGAIEKIVDYALEQEQRAERSCKASRAP
jgi:hypothetical protein